jgi:DNA modification methylase/superfamily II DNA or RNA helicase
MSCRWFEPCEQPSYWFTPIPLCEEHGKELKRMSAYTTFLLQKRMVAQTSGVEVPESDINPVLYDFQRDIVRWALKRGRAAVFADCGLGKTPMQVEWARHVGGRVLILAPLCVAEQTIAQGRSLLDTNITFVRDQTELPERGIAIANYEMLRHFIGAPLDGIVLDESSILKSMDGKTRGLLLESFTDIPWRLCCTATPCPNDIAELANHAEFLGVMRRVEMLAAFFVHDEDGWRLRGHAREPFFRWLASWAMSLKSPADLGYDDSRFNLPPLEILDTKVKSTAHISTGQLFGGLKGIGDRSRVRRLTVKDRVNALADLIRSQPDEQWIVWCGLNDEQDRLAEMLGDECVSIDGRTSTLDKIRLEGLWRSGQVRTLLTKTKVFGYGMNWQHCSRVAFLGMGDSYEQYYQAIRRSWRYGQKAASVKAYIVCTDYEQEIVANVRRKERESDSLSREIVAASQKYEIEELGRNKTAVEIMERKSFEGPDWNLEQGDCIEVMKEMPDDSIDLSVFSPPFASLYTYSASEHDLGNSKNHDEFFQHFGYVIDGLLRVTKPGRNCCVHIAQSPTTLVNDGLIGLKDLRGRATEEFCKRGWVYHGEVVIDKDPQAQAIRTHAKGLLFVQLKKDSSWLRPALADYILVFRKPGENAVPIIPDLTNDEWIEWARPIWYGIRESDTLNAAEGRDSDDDRHICPLQLGTIERCVRLWSNAGETVLSPFAGIGSEGFVSLQQERKFKGIELKPRYADVARKNLKRALGMRKQIGLFEQTA